MRIWIVTPGEPAVFHPSIVGAKIMRSAALAQTLAQNGHEVIWWTGAFQHHSKTHLIPVDIAIKTDIPGLQMQLIASPGYKSNISRSRFKDYKILAQNWVTAAKKASPPDVIVASWPPVDLGHACVCFAQDIGCKIVLDIRDLWPDTIYQRLQRKLHLPWIPKFLFGYNQKTKEAFSKATAVMGITNAFVEWGLEKAKRPRTGNDQAFFLSSYSLSNENLTNPDAALKFWTTQGLDQTNDKIVISWVGSLIDQDAIRCFLDRFSKLPVQLANRLQLVICGSGTMQDTIAKLASCNENVLYPGHIDRNQYIHLLTHTDYGLLVYDPTFDFMNSIPNKVNEYLSGGVKLLTNLDGEAHSILDAHGASSLLDISSQEVFEKKMAELVDAGTLLESDRSKMKTVFAEIFDGKMIYPRMSRYIETL